VLLPWLRVVLLIRRTLSSRWDEATWPIAKPELTELIVLSPVEPEREGTSAALLVNNLPALPV